MKSMGMIMAEASRVPVIHEKEVVEDLIFDDDHHHRLEGTVTSRQSIVVSTVDDTNELSQEPSRPSGRTLTRAALNEMEPCASPLTSTIITLGNSNDTTDDLKYIIRYFRSSCSSAASMSETTVSTPTTTTTYNSSSRIAQRRCPVRISFVPVDPDIPLQEQHGGNFDLVLHKLTEDILSCSLGEENNHAAWKRVQALKDYQRDINPGCCLVDNPSNVQTLMSRSDIARSLHSCLRDVRSTSGIPVRAPKFVVADGTESMSVLQECLFQESLMTPLMVKPLVAAGTKESHLMTIVLKLTGLSMIPPRSIIQEYVNHNAALFKVYVLGEQVYVYQRPSLPNLPPCTNLSPSTIDSLKFDSQRPYPNLADFGILEELSDEQDSTVTSIFSEAKGDNYDPHDDRRHDGGTRHQYGSSSQSVPLLDPIDLDNPIHHSLAGVVSPTTTAAAVVTADEIRPVAERLRQNFGLELFGFDIILKSTPQNEYLVVDVNYFPSYKEVPNFPSLLAHYLTQRVLQQRRQNRFLQS